ncbi:DUF927 domain-containing protein [Sulfitobacter sp. R86518]|uniref:DUF927 domain-containing protein n=1 Tax=Sulfitobacter sp. R86518 TaxID=3093858 RepID=UPI0036DAD09E
MNDMTKMNQLPICKTLFEGATRVMPIPADTAIPDFSDKRGFAGAYTYTDAQGGIVGLAIRINLPMESGKRAKKFMNLTLWNEAERGHVWTWRGLPKDRPLYRLKTLLDRPDDAVLIVEGEKCADAAVEAFPNCVAVTWMGGCNALDMTDLAPLSGRNILICPDHDAPGRDACNRLVTKLQDLGAERIRTLDIARLGSAVSGDIPAGYDIADAIDAGLTSARLHALILGDPEMLREVPMLKGTAPAAVIDTSHSSDEPINVEELHEEAEEVSNGSDILALINREWNVELTLPHGFAMDRSGLRKHELNGRGNPVVEFVSSPLAVLSRTRTGPEGTGWGYLIVLLTPLGKWKLVVVPATSLVGEGRELFTLLAAEGVTIPHTRGGRQALFEVIGHTDTNNIAEVVSQLGWSGDSFCLPDRVEQPLGSQRWIIPNSGDQSPPVSRSGDPKNWQQLASLAAGNSRATMAICVAFAAVLLKPLKEESAIFHIFGLSSRGKTTLLSLAASVWGDGDKKSLRSWLSTSNGLEGVATQHNDILLALDELGQISPDELAQVIYMLANEVGKARADKNGQARASARWKTLVLSSGEVTVSQHMQAGKLGAKGRLLGGLATRAVDIPIEISDGSGRSYETLHGCSSEAALAEQIVQLSKESYGHAGPTFVEHLVRDPEPPLATAREVINGFLDDVVATDDDPQVRRVAKHFGVVAAAGVLATKFGVVPWADGAAIDAVKTCFVAWREARGSSASEDERDAIRILKRFFELSGRSRFEPINEGHNEDVPDRLEERPVYARCGYRTTIPDKDGVPRTVYYVTSEAWHSEICDGRDGELVARIARKHGALIPGEGTRLKRKQRLPDYPNGTRVYAIQPDLLP